MSHNQQRIFDFVQKHGAISLADAVELLELPAVQVAGSLRRMVSDKLLMVDGRKWVLWAVKQSVEPQTLFQ